MADLLKTVKVGMVEGSVVLSGDVSRRRIELMRQRPETRALREDEVSEQQKRKFYLTESSMTLIGPFTC